jgi:integrase
MAFVRRFPRSPYFYGSFIGPDGKRVVRSTKEASRKKAQLIANEWEEFARGKKTDRQFLEIITELRGVMHPQEVEPSTTTRVFFDQWLERRAGEVAGATLSAYKGVSKRFLAFLVGKADEPIAGLGKRHVTDFRNAEGARVSSTTANNSLKILRVILEDARRDGLIATNPATDVGALKSVKARTRRPFTLDELKLVLGAVDGEWKGMLLCGVYLGQRIADIARLTWSHVDLQNGEISLRTRKTGRIVQIPLAAPLLAYVENLPAGDDAHAPLFPSAFVLIEAGQGPQLSRQFGEILASVGLAPVDRLSHKAKAPGRDRKRATSELSFHSLRRTATSMLKNAGVSPAIVMDLIGHDSAEISASYTTISADAKRTAIDSLPDITA